MCFDIENNILFHFIPENNQPENIVVPSGVTRISKNAFKGCTAIRSVKLPETVRSIGESAFEGCSSMTSIALPNSLAFVEGKAFAGCSSLCRLSFPESLVRIGDNALDGCTEIKHLNFPARTTDLGFYYLDNFPLLETVTFFGCMVKLNPLELKQSFNTADIRKMVVFEYYDITNLSSSIKTQMISQIFLNRRTKAAERYITDNFEDIFDTLIKVGRSDLAKKLIMDKVLVNENNIDSVCDMLINVIQKAGNPELLVFIINYKHDNFPNSSDISSLMI